MPLTAWTSSRRVPETSSGERMGGGSAAVAVGAVGVAVPDMSAGMDADGAGGSVGEAVVFGSGGCDGGSDMIGLVLWIPNW